MRPTSFPGPFGGPKGPGNEVGPIERHEWCSLLHLPSALNCCVFNPFTPKFKQYILPTFPKRNVEFRAFNSPSSERSPFRALPLPQSGARSESLTKGQRPKRYLSLFSRPPLFSTVPRDERLVDSPVFYALCIFYVFQGDAVGDDLPKAAADRGSAAACQPAEEADQRVGHTADGSARRDGMADVSAGSPAPGEEDERQMAREFTIQAAKDQKMVDCEDTTPLNCTSRARQLGRAESPAKREDSPAWDTDRAARTEKATRGGPQSQSGAVSPAEREDSPAWAADQAARSGMQAARGGSQSQSGAVSPAKGEDSPAWDTDQAARTEKELTRGGPQSQSGAVSPPEREDSPASAADQAARTEQARGRPQSQSCPVGALARPNHWRETSPVDQLTRERLSAVDTEGCPREEQELLADTDCSFVHERERLGTRTQLSQAEGVASVEDEDRVANCGQCIAFSGERSGQYFADNTREGRVECWSISCDRDKTSEAGWEIMTEAPLGPELTCEGYFGTSVETRNTAWQKGGEGTEHITVATEQSYQGDEESNSEVLISVSGAHETLDISKSQRSPPAAGATCCATEEPCRAGSTELGPTPHQTALAACAGLVSEQCCAPRSECTGQRLHKEACQSPAIIACPTSGQTAGSQPRQTGAPAKPANEGRGTAVLCVTTIVAKIVGTIGPSPLPPSSMLRYRLIGPVR